MTTAYVRDASGNVMSVYTQPTSGALVQSEMDIYGSSRLGMATQHLNPDTAQLLGAVEFDSLRKSMFTRGEKLFELSNHLSNVLVTIDDRRIQKDSNADGTADTYAANISSANDYYPFGMSMPSRNYTASSTYRYGFNGKENDKDISNGGQDYGMRIYDTRLGKFLSVDPLQRKFAWNSPYSYGEGDVIRSVDLDGLEKVIVNTVSFAPFDYFGRDLWGTYGGDGNNRKFGDNLKSTVVNNTTFTNFRIRSEAAIDLTTMKTTSAKAIGTFSHYYEDPPGPFDMNFHIFHSSNQSFSKATFEGGFYSGPVTGYKGSTLGLDYHLRGGNAAAPFGAGADIDVNVKLNFWKTGKVNEIGVNGNVVGDKFPSNENYLTDKLGNKLFLGVSGINSENKDNAPYTELPGDNKRQMQSFYFTILFNNDETFKGVRLPSGTEYNLSDWNKIFKTLNPQSSNTGTSVGTSTSSKSDVKTSNN